MSLPTHLIFKYSKDKLKMVYKVLLNQLIYLDEEELTVKTTVK